MWGNKSKQTTVSEFFKGENIFKKLAGSIFGKVQQTLSELFTPDTHKEYVLPKVIVIGNESAGKSSLLENITKCQLFPRDSKLCTKCPIHVVLNQGECKYSVSLPDGPKKHKQIDVTDKTKIYSIVEQYMSGLPMDHISGDEIIISIRDSNMPTFEFYDLPGIRTYPPESAAMTTKLCKKYLSDKNAIVLCVVPSTVTRLTSCQSIALIAEMGMEHNCILALTMADRLQVENIEELLIKRIVGTSDELKDVNFAGYVAVVNRVHSDSSSLENNDMVEQKWFNDNILSGIPDEYKPHESKIRENVTVCNLVSKLDDLYNKFIHTEWKPKILKSISEKQKKYQKECDDMGAETIDEKEVNQFINAFWKQLFVHTFEHDFDHLCDMSTYFYKEEWRKVSNDKGPDDGDVSDIGDIIDGDDDVYVEPYSAFPLQEKIYSKDRYITREDIYYDMERVVSTYIESLACGYFTTQITTFFADDEKYNLIRFENVKQKYIDMIINQFGLLTKTNAKQIVKDMKSNLMRDMCFSFGYNEIYNSVPRHITSLYKLHILHPLSKLQIDFSSDDYYESDEYKRKREDLKLQLEKCKEHHDKIMSI